MPSLARAREQANMVKCLSNLRQLAGSFVMYANENGGRLPSAGAKVSGVPEDSAAWAYWDAPRKFEESPFAPYVGGFKTLTALQCPSDDVTNRPKAQPVGPFPLSYVYNRFFTQDWKAYGFTGGVSKMGQVRNSSRKVMVVEEDERTIDDGRWEPHLGNYPAEYGGSGTNLLSVRHDRLRKEPDVPNLAGWSWVPNPDRRGNAAFADGHAEYTPRNVVHDKNSFDPKL
ncbi:MAG: N-terminal cleavage protein [Phycisphaerales bacterium]|nr:N-terminal cleavage protein [Phycisphaerales bacterium]